jgi:beta-hydroxylase
MPDATAAAASPPSPADTPPNDAPPNGSPPDAPPDGAVQATTFEDRRDPLLKRLVQRGLHGLDGVYGRFSRVGDRPFHAPEQFPWARTLEAHWPVIRDELDGILRYREAIPNFQDISKEATTISRGDDWKTFFLYGYGQKEEGNCARCPRTTELIEQVPGMTTAFFSILSPGKHIPAHRGPYKGVLRYHLGLKVPTPAARCRLRVADRFAHWEEGQSLIFDDTYEHEVWNETDGERAILFMDVMRPLPPLLHALNHLIIHALGRSPIIQEARKNQRTWSRRMAEAEARAEEDA